MSSRKVAWGAAACVAAIMLVAIYGLFLFSWKDFAMRRGSSETGREITIDGDFSIDWGRYTRIAASQVKIANLEGSDEPHLLSAEHIIVTVDLLSLLKGSVVLPVLEMKKPHLVLEKDAKGKGNWEFISNPAGAVATAVAPDERGEFPAIGRLRITDGTLLYRDPTHHTNVALLTSQTRGKASENDNLTLTGKGTLNRQPFRLQLTGASVLTLRDTHTPYPVTIDAGVGSTTIQVKGTVSDPLQLEGLDLNMHLKGASMSELFPIFGIALPPSPPYDLKGALTYNKSAETWKFANFSGRMGDSDLRGNALWDKSKKRPKLTANLTSNRLDFDDLGALIGGTPGTEPGETASVKQKQKAAINQASPYVIPDAPLDISRVAAMDADVEFKGKKVISANLPLDDFYLHAILDNSLLQLRPLKFGTADGDIAAIMEVNARAEPVRIHSDFTFRRLSLARLFENMQIGNPNANQGYIGGTARLDGTGKSLRQMLATSSGNIGLGMEGGQLSNLLIELLGLDIAESLGFMLAGDQAVPIRCVVADFEVRGGTMHTRNFVVDTADTNVGGSGTVNLKNEQLNLKLDPKPKDPSMLVLRSPLHVKGTLKNPEVSIDKGPLVARGGAAAALSILTPIAAALAFIEPGLGKDSNCAAMIAEMNRDTGKKAQANNIPVNP